MPRPMKKHTTRPSLPSTFSHALIAGFLPLTLHGLDLTWDTTTADAIVTDGPGTWKDAEANWWDGAADQNWTNGDTATFGGTAGTAGTVTLGSDITTANAGDSLTFNAPFDGSYTLDLAGFTLNTATNNVAQPILVAAGSPVVIDDTVGTGAYVTTNTGNTRFANLSSTLTFHAKVTDADGSGTGTNGAMFITGGGGLTFTNPDNDFTGRVGKQNGGRLTLKSIANSGLPSAAGAGSDVYIAFNAQLFYNGTGDSTDRTFSFGGTSSGSIFSSGSGPLIWTGPFQNSTSGTGTRTLNFRGTNTGSNDFQGDLVDSTIPLAISKLDAGNWIFSGDNTYTGQTTLSNGTLQANAADVPSTSGALGNGGPINFNGGTLQYSAASAGTDYGSRFANSASPINLDTNSQNVALASVIADTNTAGLTKAGTGILSLSGDSIYTGTTTISDGTLQVDAADVLDGGDPSITLSGALGSGGNIDFAGGTLQYTANSAATDYSARIVNSTSPMTFDTNGQDVTFTNNLAASNSGGLTKEGAGTLIAKYANGNYTGLTVVNGGTLQILKDDGGNTWTAGNFEINNGSRLEINSSVTAVFQNRTWTFDTTGGGTLDLQGNTIFQTLTNTIVTTGGPKNFVTGDRYNLQNSNKINYDVADGSDAVDLEVSVRHDRGAIGKTGDGTLALTDTTNNLAAAGNPNSITIEAGVVELAAGGRINNGNWDGVITTDGIFRHNSTANQTLNGVISGTGSIEQNGSGSLTLSAANTYTGDTTATAGTLALIGTSLTSDVIVGSAATLGTEVDMPATTTGTATFSPGATVSVAGTPVSGDYTLLTAASITGTPTLSAPIPGWTLQVVGNALVLVADAGPTYEDWAAINAGGQTPEEDFDLDGVKNGVEFFFNSPAGFTANPGLVSGSITWTNGGNIPSSEYGSDKQFYVQTSSDLGTWDEVDSEDVNLTNTEASVVYTPSDSAPFFIRFVVNPTLLP